MEKETKKINEMIEGFSPRELAFLMNFNKKSKRAKVNHKNEVYKTMKILGVVKFIENCGLLVHIRLVDEYKNKYGRIRERHLEIRKKEHMELCRQQIICCLLL